MNKTKNHQIKNLQFHCSVCFTTYQLQERIEKLKTNQADKCLNKCLKKWADLTQKHYQEQIMLHLAKREQEEDEAIDEFSEQVYEKIKKGKK